MQQPRAGQKSEINAVEQDETSTRLARLEGTLVAVLNGEGGARVSSATGAATNPFANPFAATNPFAAPAASTNPFAAPVYAVGTAGSQSGSGGAADPASALQDQMRQLQL